MAFDLRGQANTPTEPRHIDELLQRGRFKAEDEILSGELLTGAGCGGIDHIESSRSGRTGVRAVVLWWWIIDVSFSDFCPSDDE